MFMVSYLTKDVTVEICKIKAFVMLLQCGAIQIYTFLLIYRQKLHSQADISFVFFLIFCLFVDSFHLFVLVHKKA
jgi:hypothetical protein